MLRKLITTLIFSCIAYCSFSQLMEEKDQFTHLDTLRGSITKYREGWDVLQYDIEIQPDIVNKSIEGKVKMTWYEQASVATMQIDLQSPLLMDSVIGVNGISYSFSQQNDICLIYLKDSLAFYKISPGVRTLTFYYHGIPRKAIRAPWDGGLVWSTDSIGRPFIATACQGLGASCWWPCKDHQSDEPDNGTTISIIVPDTLAAISNGRLESVKNYSEGLKIWSWKVVNPINTYGVTMNIGKYTQWKDTLQGEGGVLDLEYWVLDYNLDKAKSQFMQVKQMLRSHEYWFGKYPFYEDGYKVIETPFLGMEHQSGIAYGNKFENGYLGKDISKTGWGFKWDYILVHESGHEWYGNNITSSDIADMWIHEGFTSYSEVLFIEYYFGKKAGQEYCKGIRSRIKNDRPIIGFYEVNKEGSVDMYFKGSNLINTIRNTINDDSWFRLMLRRMNNTFYHQTVTTQEIEDYISEESGIDFSKVFDQYLRTTNIPTLEYLFSKNKKEFCFRWKNVVAGFNLPLIIHLPESEIIIPATESWRQMEVPMNNFEEVFAPTVEKSYYIKLKQVKSKQ